MNIGEIRRYVNDGQIPLSGLIGSAADAASDLSLFGSQKKYLRGWNK